MKFSLFRSIALCLSLWGLLFSGSLVSAFDGGTISAGAYHTCGIRTDGTVTCWGYNGNGESTPPSGPFSQASAGAYHTCGIRTDGTVTCWGNNAYGQSTPPSGTFSQISAGESHTCGIRTDGTVTCWGYGAYGQSTPPSGTFSQISAGSWFHSCGIRTDGTVTCWGYNLKGESTSPSGLFSQVGAGAYYSCGLKMDGTVTCWGNNAYGQSTPPSGTFSQISVGLSHSCGLKMDGTVTCWGDDTSGKTTPPSGVFSQVSTWGSHTCGIRTDGTVACWGYSGYGQSTPPADLFSVPVGLVSLSPSDSATGVSIYRPIISATFSTPIDTSTLTGNIVLTSSIGTSVPITVVSNTGGVIQIRPDNNLIGSTTYMVTYMTGIMSTLGTHFASNKSTSFTTAYVPPPQENTPIMSESCLFNTFCSYNFSALPEALSNIYKQHLSEISRVDEQNIADPVTLANGESTYTNTFLKLPNKGSAYELTLTNKSRTNYDGPIGYNWDHSYNRFLRANPDGSIDYYDGRLGVRRFSQSASGSFVPDNILRASLAQTASGYMITYLDGTVETYGTNLHISSLKDANNNQFIFSYDTGSRLTLVTDGNNNQINYSYYPDGRIMTVSAPGGRSVAFHYDSDANLISVDAVNNGNTRTLNYTYSSQDPDTKLSHNLISFTDAKGQIYVTNTYDANDRVISQKYGSGTVYYNYTLDGGGALVTKNTVTNRRGIITEYSYDSNGNTTSTTVKGTGGLSDITYIYTYDTYGRKITETKPLGNGTKYTYNGSGNLTEVRVKANMSLADDSVNDLVTSYFYDGSGNTTKVILPNGKVTNLTYDTANRLIRTDITIGTGTITNIFSYDNYGRLIQKLDGENNPIQYEYNILNLPTKIKTGSGIEQSIVTYTYDTYGNPQTMIDGENNTTSFSYDVFDRLLSETSPEGVVKGYIYDANNNKIGANIILSGSESFDTTTSYDILDKPTQINTEVKNGTTAITKYNYDANGNITQTIFPNGLIENRTYDMMERLITKTTIGSQTSVISYTYDANGNLISENKNGNITSYSYDLYDRRIRTTDALGGYRSVTYDKVGNTLSNKFSTSTGILMQETNYTYDILSRLTKVSEKKLEDSTYRDTTYTYDRNGNILTEKNALNYVTIYTYDSLGRQRTKTIPNGLQYENIYDKVSNIITEKNISASGTIIVTHTYDRDGRKISSQDNMGNITQYQYNQLGQVIRITDPSNTDTIYTYNYLGNILTETRAGKTTTYEYNLMGNRTKLTDALGNITNYGYSLEGQISYEKQLYTGNIQRTTSYNYNANGDLSTKTDPNGTTVTHIYDALGRLTRKNISYGSQSSYPNTSKYTTYTYDALGRLLSATSEQGYNNIFTYDSLSNLTKDQIGANSVGGINLQYDILGRITRMPYSQTIGYANISYDNLNRITQLSDPSNIPYVNWTYNQRSLIREQRKNTLGTNYVYDALGRLSGISGSGYVTPLIYAYDPNSNILSKGQNAYTYNTRDELTRVVYAPGTYSTMSGATYAYDLMGNRKTESILSNITLSGETLSTLWNYQTGSQNTYTSITAGSGLSYTGVFLSGTIIYDANGNIRGNQIGTQKQYLFSYDSTDRLTSIEKYTTPTTKITLVLYYYDGIGRRAEKDATEPGKNRERTLYTYYKNHILEEFIQEYQPTGLTGNSITKNYIYGGGLSGVDSYNSPSGGDDTAVIIQKYVKKIGNIMPYPSTTTTYYTERDHLGSIDKIYDASGSTIEEYTYTPYGGTSIRNQYTNTGAYTNQYIPIKLYTDTLLPSIANGNTGTLYGNNRLFTGREYDRETGLYYLRARYYDPVMGRFIQEDPIGTKDDTNLYRYVKSNPLNYTDRDGKMAKKALINGWNTYMDGSDRLGSYLYTNFSPYEQDIVGTIDRTREYSGYVGLAATPFLFFPPTTPFAAGIIGATGVMSLGAGGVESYVTQDKSYAIQEGVGFFVSKFGGNALQEAGVISDATFNTSAWRYMGHYTDGTYGFLKNGAGQMGIAISQTVEQVIGWTAQQLAK